MKILKFSYSTVYTFASDVTEHEYTVKCCPATMDRQNISQLNVDVTPGDYSSTGVDSWGNHFVYGRIGKPHNEFRYDITGMAEVRSERVDISEQLIGLYRRQTGITKPGEMMFKCIDMILTCQGEFDNDMEFCRYVNTCVGRLLTYKQWHTNVKTTAEQALMIGQGVCQDYAHIMIGILRNLGIPARYVVGIMTGEGSSHAWVEAYIDGGWYGFDPTNNKMADDDYIKISHGRDYSDCILMRGMFKGLAGQSQRVCVKVEEVQNFNDKEIAESGYRRYGDLEQ